MSGCEVNGRSARSSIGTPRMERNCLGSPGPARTPAPAATITTPTSGCEAAGEVTDAVHADAFAAFRCAARARGAEHAAESLPGRLREPPLEGGDGPDLAAQSHLAEEHGVGRDGTVVDAGDERRHYGEGAERQPAAPLQHREQHGEAAVVEPGGDALRRPEARF